MSEKDRELSMDEMGEIIISMERSLTKELFQKTQSEVFESWYFKWNDSLTIEYNLYKFNDMLSMYSRSCRRWEEHHNGSCCVVERVRDTYLLPRIREFILPRFQND